MLGLLTKMRCHENMSQLDLLVPRMHTKNVYFIIHSYIVLVLVCLRKKIAFHQLCLRKNRISYLKRFGDYICLDVMKRELIYLHWPYIAMSLRNELVKVAVMPRTSLCPSEDGESSDHLLRRNKIILACYHI